MLDLFLLIKLILFTFILWHSINYINSIQQLTIIVEWQLSSFVIGITTILSLLLSASCPWQYQYWIQDQIKINGVKSSMKPKIMQRRILETTSIYVGRMKDKKVLTLIICFWEKSSKSLISMAESLQIKIVLIDRKRLYVTNPIVFLFLRHSAWNQLFFFIWDTIQQYKGNNKSVLRCLLFVKIRIEWIKIHDLLLAHFSGLGRESSLPDVSSVVASGLMVVTVSMSMGMVNTLTTPSATHAQILWNFSISPEII